MLNRFSALVLDDGSGDEETVLEPPSTSGTQASTSKAGKKGPGKPSNKPSAPVPAPSAVPLPASLAVAPTPAIAAPTATPPAAPSSAGPLTAHIDPASADFMHEELHQRRRFLKYPFFWVDCEMTGLDLTQHRIIEIACVLTDGWLNRSVQGPEIVIHANDEELRVMNDWSREQHELSGLTAKVRASTTTMAQAEDQILSFLREHVPEPRVAITAGNSVHVDLQFLKKDMPRVAEWLSYRVMDVSTLKELCFRWYPDRRAPPKEFNHTARKDIEESIKELKFYRENIFRAGYSTGPFPAPVGAGGGGGGGGGSMGWEGQRGGKGGRGRGGRR